MEVKLAQRILDLTKFKTPPLGYDFDSGPKVLELGALGEIGYVEFYVRGGDHLEDAVDHVDGGLSFTGSANCVRFRVESYPVHWSLVALSVGVRRKR
jgi:hypothetical protein